MDPRTQLVNQSSEVLLIGLFLFISLCSNLSISSIGTMIGLKNSFKILKQKKSIKKYYLSFILCSFIKFCVVLKLIFQNL